MDNQQENTLTIITSDHTVSTLNVSITWMHNIIIVLAASEKPFIYLNQTIQLTIVSIAIVTTISIIANTIIRAKEVTALVSHQKKLNELPR